MFLEEWLNLEKDFGEFGDVGFVQVKMLKKFKRRRFLMIEDGLIGYEFFCYIIFFLQIMF